MLIGDGEVDRRRTGRCNRDGEEKRVRRVGGTTRANADRNERDCENRQGEGRENLACLEYILLFCPTFMVADRRGVLVAGSGLAVILQGNGDSAEDGRGYRQDEGKREDETVRE